MPQGGNVGGRRGWGGATALAAVAAVIAAATAIAWPHGQGSPAAPGRTAPRPATPSPGAELLATSGHSPVQLPPGIGANEWALTALQASVLWEHSEGQGIKVAVVDTGIDAAATDLQGAVLNSTQDAAPPAHSHGTEIAAIIAGRGVSAVLGLAPRAELIDVPVTSDAGNVSQQDIADGINAAVSDGAEIINVSLTVPTDPGGIIQGAVTNAWNHDVLVVASAGANGADAYPAVANNAVAVGGAKPGQGHQPIAKLTGDDGPNDVYAPGADLYSVGRIGQSEPGLEGNDFAAAYVSAAAALLLAVQPDPHKIDMYEFRKALIGSTSKGPGFLDPLTVLQKTPYVSFPPFVQSSPPATQSSSAATQPTKHKVQPTRRSQGKQPIAAPPGLFHSTAVEVLLFGLLAVLVVLVGWLIAAVVRGRVGPPEADFNMDD